MPEIEHMNNDALNRLPAEFLALLNLEHLVLWTEARQREHNADHGAYENTLLVFSTALRSQHVEGDGRLSAWLRARRVEKHLNRLVKASRVQAQAVESLRTAYASHVRTVQALPAQREAQAARKADRRGRVNNSTVKSLNKTVGAMPGSATTTEPGGETAAQGPRPGGTGRTVRGVNDLFDHDRKGA